MFSSYLVLIPAIKFFGVRRGRDSRDTGTMPIGRDGLGCKFSKAYILYIGAGAVAAGGIISLVRSLPLIWHGMKGGLADLRRASHGKATAGAHRSGSVDEMGHRRNHRVAPRVIMIAPQLNLQFNLLGALLIVVIGFLFVTVSSRLTGEIGSSSCPTSGMTVATLLLTCLVFLVIGWTAPPYFVTALSIGGIVCIASSNGGTTSQDLKTGFLVGSTPKTQQIAILVGTLASALVLGPILLGLNNSYTVYVPPTTFQKIEAGATPPRVQVANLPPFHEKIKPDTTGHYRLLHNEKGGVNSIVPGLNPGDYLVNEKGEVVYKLEHNFSPDLRAPNDAELGPPEHLKGAQANMDQQLYRSWQRSDPNGGGAQRFLVNDQREAVYLVDPGINGTHKIRPDGSTVTKFDAPKATLMSYIIKGILGHQLPWALVLLGVMISIVLEMSGIPSLAFAVGVYLPLSSSTPIFVGGMIRLLVDRWLRRHKFKDHDLTHEALVAEGDKSSGVLLASGYIAGSAITGIVIALMNLVPSLAATSDRLTAWATAHNPFFAGPHADLLALIPFAGSLRFALPRRARRAPCAEEEQSLTISHSILATAAASRLRCELQHADPDRSRSAQGSTPLAPLFAASPDWGVGVAPPLWGHCCLLGRFEIFRGTQAHLQGGPEIAQPERTRARTSRPVAEENAIDQRTGRRPEARYHHRRRENSAAAAAGNQSANERAANHDESGRNGCRVRHEQCDLVRRRRRRQRHGD